MENVFKGFGVALVTPFRQDGSVDYAALGHLVEMQLGAGVDFFCVLGSTAETPCLSNDEKLLIKDFVINLVRGRVPILLGFGGNCKDIQSRFGRGYQKQDRRKNTHDGR